MSEVAQTRRLPPPVSARVPLLDGLVPADEAFSVIVFECLAHMSANIPAVIEAHDSEGLHQFRVGLRRLRTALSAFGKSLPVMQELNGRAKAIGLAVGPARDLDVFAGSLFDPAVAELGASASFTLLRHRVEKARERAWCQARGEITKPQFRIFQDAVATAAMEKHWPCNGALGDVAPHILHHQFKRAQKRGRSLVEASPPERHALRIALKKLRYTGEFFAPLYKKKAVRAFVEPMKELQDLLGHLNDAAQVRSITGHLMMEHAESAVVQTDLSHATGLLVGWHQARTGALLKKTAKRWKGFKKAEVFWE